MEVLLFVLLASGAWAAPPAELAASESPVYAAAQENERLDFETVPVGALPEGWKIEATHPADNLAAWAVAMDSQAPSGEHVLSVKVGEFHRGTFNLCWTDGITFQEGTIEVRVRADQGRVDQGGGLIWRARDKDNYYVARWNPLEDNFRAYYVKDARRVQLAGADLHVAPDAWHTLRIEQRGDHILGFLDGQKLLDVHDRTFTEAGGIGFWTKADASSQFDDLKISR